MSPGTPHGQPGPTIHRVADVQLRGSAGPLAARAYWPAPSDPAVTPALVVLFPDGGAPGDLDAADELCRGLCACAGVVVLSVICRAPAQGQRQGPVDDAMRATAWAADHAAQLGADPRRLLVAGPAHGGNLAASVALLARDHGWPTITRQVLICADVAAPPQSQPGAPSVAGVAAATVVTTDDHSHGGAARSYAAALRGAGVDVEELHYRERPRRDRVLRDLARALRHALEAT
jgi:acetyl esterase/lipase